jgi:enoyl-CoA hydratase/carnithine racemase
MTDALSPDGDLLLLREFPTRSGLKIGHGTLNAEKTINSLNFGIVRPLQQALAAWAADTQVACVVLHGAGRRVFCAGGDLRFLREGSLAYPGPGPTPQMETFMSEQQYRLDYTIQRYPKPILVWGDGVVMGGGLSMFVGASHRVVTETSRLAMPEVGIGLFPDAAASWFLQRGRGRIGLFLALTGTVMNAADALFMGLADFVIRSESRAVVLEQIRQLELTGDPENDAATLSLLLTTHAQNAEQLRLSSRIEEHASVIEWIMKLSSFTAVRSAISTYVGSAPWLQAAAKSHLAASPTSVALVWEVFRRARHMSLAEALRLDLGVVLQCYARPDFAEGVRALVIDKDRRPRWTPATPGEVTAQWIEEHFALRPWANAEGINPLSDLT